MKTWKSKPFRDKKLAIRSIMSDPYTIKISVDKWQSTSSGVRYYVDGSNRVVHCY
jgi:hypothetical protein